MAADFNFGEFSVKFKQTFGDEGVDMRELLIKKSVMKPADFFDNMQQNMQKVASTITPTRELGTVGEFAELFRELDTYPNNLQRVPKKRELQRTNSSILKGNESTDQASPHVSTSNVSLNNISRHVEQRTASEVYKDFRKFQENLRQLKGKVSAQEKPQAALAAMLSQLHNFVQQLEKLMPCELDAPDAFTESEQANLLAIAANMEQLNFLHDNKLSLSQLANPRDSDAAFARLETLVDVLNYTLRQISCYNSI
ncbi:msd5 [Drosophila busckii]|uniref:Msd5 n=1 Tax=Drosophila busckii TaxID=30019 RepID=A0A0M4EC86_DROBS|nr:augmin complex subunit msd5 [Drosophila busckii]ALC42996.1 msd5 [Drosophila busckii]